MTTKQILRASEGFEQPFKTLSTLRGHLAQMREDRLIQFSELPRYGPGLGERLYHLSRRARRLVPEVSDLRPGHRLLRPLPPSQLEHAMGVADFLSLMHRDVARSGGRAKVLAILGDHQLRLRVDPSRYGLPAGTLVPDGTLLLELAGKPQLLFLELMNQGAVTRPGLPRTVRRSFQAKLLRYKALARSLPENPELQALCAELGIAVPAGLRALVVSARTEVHLQHLGAAASHSTSLARFAHLEALLDADQNSLLDPIWQLPGGDAQAIA